jgi:hypothetical protein
MQVGKRLARKVTAWTSRGIHEYSQGQISCRKQRTDLLFGYVQCLDRMSHFRSTHQFEIHLVERGKSWVVCSCRVVLRPPPGTFLNFKIFSRALRCGFLKTKRGYGGSFEIFVIATARISTQSRLGFTGPAAMRHCGLPFDSWTVSEGVPPCL